MLESLKEKKWTGLFFTGQSESEDGFAGELSYSFEQGVLLKYLSLKEIDNFGSLYGILSSGEKCTLTNVRTYTKNYVPRLKNGLRSYPGTISHQFLIVGDHLDETQLIGSVDFSLTNLQEFFFPEGRKDFVKFQSCPLLDIKSEYGRIKITNTATFESFHKQKASGLFYSDDSRVLDELQSYLDQVAEKYPDSNLDIKKEISFQVNLEFDSNVKVEEAYKHVESLSNLFSILLYCPVFPDEITAQKYSEEYQHLNIYPSVVRDQRTVKLSIKRRSHYGVSITHSDINLEEVISKWLGLAGRFPTLISSIQRDTGYIDLHSAYGEFILLATQLEAITKEDSKDKREKYTYPIGQYATKEILEHVEWIFLKAEKTDIGSAISDLRGELAHIYRPQTLLNTLGFSDIANLCQYLQMTILGFALTKLGIDRGIIDKYQNQII